MKKHLSLVWNVYDYHFSVPELRIFNVFNHESFLDSVEKLLAKDMPKEEFPELLRRQALYYYWSKTEWECIITDTNPQICRNELCRLLSECYEQLPKSKPTPRHFCINLVNSYKLDIYSQIMLNWDEFVDYVWQHSKTAKKLKKEGTNNVRTEI